MVGNRPKSVYVFFSGNYELCLPMENVTRCYMFWTVARVLLGGCLFTQVYFF